MDNYYKDRTAVHERVVEMHCCQSVKATAISFRVIMITGDNRGLSGPGVGKARMPVPEASARQLTVRIKI